MGRRKKKNNAARVIWPLTLAAAFLMAGFWFIGGRDRLSLSRLPQQPQGARHVKSVFRGQMKNLPLIPPQPELLNEEEKAFIWTQEFDSAIQKALPKMASELGHLAISGDTKGKFLLPIKRVIEVRAKVPPWMSIRRAVFDLVQTCGGKVFQEPRENISSSARKMIFLLGSSQAHVPSYILIFQLLTEEPPSTNLGAGARGRRSYKPAVALVIDDLGYSLSLAKELFSLNLTLTVSVLPHHPFSRDCAELAHEHSCEVILHLPMQPRRCALAYWEKNTLQVNMRKEQIIEILDSGLGDVPWAVGVNNHMGSLMLEDRASMQVILDELKSRGLYFLDSRTTPKSIGYELAQSLGVPSAFRHIFLDNNKSIGSIRHQIDLLIEMAVKNGQAIGIGHLHPTMIQGLRESAQKFHDRGITLVRLSELVE